MASGLEPPSSSGHKLGQIVGDWWELHVVFPMLRSIAERLDLFVDNRCVARNCRSGKIEWSDVDGNIVDYDFVFELRGTDAQRGIPVAFFESFWRRGARHSKDKARDDTNKLLPMRATYPTARYLAIAACGEFTAPAREYVQNRAVELFYVPKSQIIRAFAACGLQIDYSDRATEVEKSIIASALDTALDDTMKHRVAEALRDGAGHATFDSFAATVVGRLSAAPQEIRFVAYRASNPVRFASVAAASDFLENVQFDVGSMDTHFGYGVTYSDGSEFSRDVATLEDLRDLHASLTGLVNHMEAIAARL